MATLFDILVIAVVANVMTDAYELTLERLFGKTRDWHLVGRWVAHMLKGSIFLDPADETRTVPGELAIGWIFHYIVAIAYVALYLFCMQSILGEPPTIGTAVVFGMVTVAAPWFILMPCLGVGVFAKKAPKPNFIRAASLSIHTVFGFGIYLGVVVAKAI